MGDGTECRRLPAIIAGEAVEYPLAHRDKARQQHPKPGMKQRISGG